MKFVLVALLVSGVALADVQWTWKDSTAFFGGMAQGARFDSRKFAALTDCLAKDDNPTDPDGDLSEHFGEFCSDLQSEVVPAAALSQVLQSLNKIVRHFSDAIYDCEDVDKTAVGKMMEGIEDLFPELEVLTPEQADAWIKELTAKISGDDLWTVLDPMNQACKFKELTKAGLKLGEVLAAMVKKAGQGSQGCTITQGCAPKQYCKLAALKCGEKETGTCVDRPQVCYKIYRPVCGCNDQTYGNDCEAASNGQNVASLGACNKKPANDTCTKDSGCTIAKSFCATKLGQCAHDAPGNCVARPDMCPMYIKPVCGCDGRTYNNPCEANRGGVNVKAQGPCSGSPPVQH